MKKSLCLVLVALSSVSFAVGSSTLPAEGPGLLPSLLMGIVAAGILLGAVGALVMLVGMAAQAVVLGRPTLPPREEKH